MLWWTKHGHEKLVAKVKKGDKLETTQNLKHK